MADSTDSAAAAAGAAGGPDAGAAPAAALVAATPGNAGLLGGLSHAERARLAARMEQVHVARADVLIWPDEPITHAYFPIDGVISLLSLTDGEEVEAGVIGYEGMVGVPLLLGTATTHLRAVCQVAGDAWRLPADTVREEMARPGPLRERLLRYAQSLFQQVAQTSGCNRVHPVQERCARWLLMVQDRVQSDTFLLTQEFLSQMLGVRRPSVTVVMGALQQAGLLRYHRGTITVLDRPGLEAAACECYAIIAREHARLLA